MPPLSDQEQFDLAREYHRAGRLAEAGAIYRALLARYPGQADLLHLLGVLAGQGGDAHTATDLIRKAIATNPGVAQYHSNLAVWLLHLGQLESAAAAHEHALRLDPQSAEAHFNLGFVRLRQRDWAAAAACYRQAIALKPELADAYLKLGMALSGAGRTAEAAAALRSGLDRLPHSGPLWNNLGNALRECDDLDGAVAAFRSGLRCEPENEALLNNLGNAMRDQGLLDEAIVCFRHALEVNPDCRSVHDNLVFTLHFHPGGELAREIGVWNQRHALPLRQTWPPHTGDRSSERPLRIGYVSADFCNHPVGRFMRPVLAQHDRERYEIICYSDAIPDALTTELRGAVALWRDTTEMDDDQLAAQIRADAVDILVDLALHTAGNRLLVFARKPAAVQVSWLGYAGTTGLAAIDYRITDGVIDPPGTPPVGVTEKAVRLPACWCCYQPAESAPPVSPLPAEKNGWITFASFNAFAKHNEDVFALWAEILRRVDRSRLLMVVPPGTAQERTRAIFQHHDIDPDRVEFLGRVPASDYLRRYERVDIALDPFPFNGMTTTCDALWMGVPVIALIGGRPCARTAFSILDTVGLTKWGAAAPDRYIDVAVAWASDRSRLAALRAGLRERMKASPLMDTSSFVRSLEAAYRSMWWAP